MSGADRLKGVLLLRQVTPDASQAEVCFHQVLDIACHQQAISRELRAVTGLSRLWRGQERRDDARQLLEPVYAWFTVGFDTVDLIEVKALLNELEGSP